MAPQAEEQAAPSGTNSGGHGAGRRTEPRAGRLSLSLTAQKQKPRPQGQLRPQSSRMWCKSQAGPGPV